MRGTIGGLSQCPQHAHLSWRAILSRLRWLVIEMARRLWLRAAFFAAAGVLTAVAGIALEPIIPVDWSGRIGAESIGNVLQILASSMLSVATFSLGVMVAAYAAASVATTPRVAELLIEDSSAQNALATFIGSFLFSLVGIIALNTGLYGEGGRAVLFLSTLVVIAIIVLTLLRWIDLLSRFGRVGDAIDRVEEAASDAMCDRLKKPCLGGRQRTGSMPTVASVSSEKIGYLQHIDLAVLERIATRQGGEIHVDAVPGDVVDPGLQLVWMDFEPHEDDRAAIQKAFDIAPRRSFDQDPRFGIIVLAEIAVKALSPAVNDPGTAIATLTAQVRVLMILAEAGVADPEVEFPHVCVPTLSVDDLFDDAFSSVSEACSATLAVGIRLQKALQSLSRLGPSGFHIPALRQSRRALDRARLALALPEDVGRLERAGTPLA